MKCPECEGDGVIYTTEDTPCPECDGSGEVESDDSDDEDSDDEDSDDCPVCGGCGGGSFTCSRCHGSGRNLDRERERREDYAADQWDAKEDR